MLFSIAAVDDDNNDAVCVCDDHGIYQISAVVLIRLFYYS